MLNEKWHGRATIVVVYLREAHATDEWPMGNHVQVKQARCFQERALAASQFVTATNLTVTSIFVDNEEDKFMHLLSAHPQRFFVIDCQGVLRLKAAPVEGGYDISEVGETLEQLCS